MKSARTNLNASITTNNKDKELRNNETPDVKQSQVRTIDSTNNYQMTMEVKDFNLFTSNDKDHEEEEGTPLVV